MDTYKDVNITKFKQFERLENVAIDSSALSQFKWCPLSYFYRYVLCMKPKEDEVYLTWGNCVHKFYETAEKEYKNVPNIPIAATKGIVSALEVWGTRKDPSLESKFAFMTKARLADTLMYIAKFWQKEKEQNQFKVLQSEMPFLIQLPYGQWITGKIDQIVEEARRNFIRDFKSTAKKWQWYKKSLNPSDQFIGYTYAGSQLTKSKLAGCYVDVICTSEKEGPTLHREPVLFSDGQISNWLREREQWSKILDSCRESDVYPKNERNCPYCPFLDVCTTREEGGQMFMLKSKFKKEQWDPIAQSE